MALTFWQQKIRMVRLIYVPHCNDKVMILETLSREMSGKLHQWRLAKWLPIRITFLLLLFEVASWIFCIQVKQLTQILDLSWFPCQWNARIEVFPALSSFYRSEIGDAHCNERMHLAKSVPREKRRAKYKKMQVWKHTYFSNTLYCFSTCSCSCPSAIAWSSSSAGRYLFVASFPCFCCSL